MDPLKELNKALTGKENPTMQELEAVEKKMEDLEEKNLEQIADLEKQQTIEIEEEEKSELWGQYQIEKMKNIKAYLIEATEYAARGNEEGAQAFLKGADQQYQYMRDQITDLLTTMLLEKK